MLTEGSKVPLDLKLIAEDGRTTTLTDFLTDYLVVYFYPKDDTPGCTKEACGFRDNHDSLRNIGATVVGISKDSQKSHNKFKSKYDLDFPLLSDPDHQVMEAFGVWQEKQMMGRKYMGTVRATFIINREGEIIKVYPKVKPAEHAREVYEFIQSQVK